MKYDPTILRRIDVLAGLPGGGAWPALNLKDAPAIDAVLAEHIELVTKSLTKLKAADTTADEKMAELRSEITELAQKMDRGGRGGALSSSPTTWGRQVSQSENLKGFIAASGDRPGRMRIEVKTITSATGSGNAMAYADQVDPVMRPRRSLAVRDLLTIVPTTSGAVEYPKQTTRTNNAAPVAETELKPESDYAFEQKALAFSTIAHWITASNQVLDDAPQLEGLIDGELRYGLQLAEDGQLLLGSGSGVNVHGIIPQATAYTAPIVIASATMIDQIGLALLQVTLGDLPCEGIVLHPSDWLKICLLKDAAGGYLFMDPQKTTAPTLFGVPVSTTVAMPQGKFLVGAFRTAATLYERMTATVLLSTEDRDNFIRNRTTILAEERVGLALKQASGFVYGTFV